MANVNASRATAEPTLFAGAGVVQALVSYYDIASAQSANDTITFGKLPAGAVIIGGWLRGEDIDTGTETYQLDIGWSGDTVALLDSGVLTGDVVTGILTGASVWMPLQGDLTADGVIALTEEKTVIGTVTAAAQAGGTGMIQLVVLYVPAFA